MSSIGFRGMHYLYTGIMVLRAPLTLYTEQFQPLLLCTLYFPTKKRALDSALSADTAALLSVTVHMTNMFTSVRSQAWVRQAGNLLVRLRTGLVVLLHREPEGVAAAAAFLACQDQRSTLTEVVLKQEK